MAGTDSKAKATLASWPVRPGKLWSSPGRKATWMRAYPKVSGDSTTAPYLGSPAAKAFKTRPDGLWLATDRGDVADVFCVEHCGKIQNLNDKRSRYSVFASSVVVFCSASWFDVDVPKQGGGSTARWRDLGFEACPKTALAIPVRYLRVLYAIPDADYAGWMKNSAPAAHEYFCKHSSFKSYNSQKMQTFLSRMSPMNQFYTTT